MAKIITQLIGGLGNQFFQYAVAKAIALKNNLELKLDLSEFETYKIRKYELSNFNVEENIASAEEILPLKKKKIFNQTYFKEKKCKFNPRVLKIKKSAYIRGFWQSERYFAEIEDVIRKEFTFKNIDFIENRKILDEIEKTNSVSISFRCGDYLSNPEAAKIHNVCTMKYYNNAIKYMKERLDNPVFYVFSDDIKWVEANFKSEEPVIFVDTANWQEDLYYIQKCKHSIVANSSFSWWAAWLNTNKEKIVIAPQKWFSDDSGLDYSNIVPKSWVKLEV